MAKVQSIKICVVGDETVGKTSLLTTYTTGKFPATYVPTTFANFGYNLVVDGNEIYIDFWDTIGTDECDRLRPIWYFEANIFFICYSLVSPSSFEHVKSKFHPEVTHHCPGVCFVLIGTKLDLREDPDVIAQLKENNQAPITHDVGMQLANEIGAKNYFECSSLTQLGLEEVFDGAVRALWSHPKPRRRMNRKCMLN